MSLWDVFLGALRASSFQAIDFVREMNISRAMEIGGIQDALRFRARFVALEAARLLVNERGDLQLDVAAELLRELEKRRYLIGPELENDAFIFEHLRSALSTLIASQEIQKILQRLSVPVCHRGAERLVRDTLWPHAVKQIGIGHVKTAILASWFTWLRQTTGSCFATAPAILIQSEQPVQLIQDLFDLLTFGALRRVVSGQEYAVPLCPSVEQFDLLRPLEGVSSWNLAVSPGMQAAFGAAGLRSEELPHWIEKEEEAKTPKELIESIFLRLFGLEWSDVKEEEGLKRLEMNPLLAKQSAVYYQRPTGRAQKVAQWKEAVEKASAAYQALGDAALLRAWEATVASLSDVKLDIAKWNLYVSLGLHPDYPGGIGDFLYQRINEKLAEFNHQLAALQNEMSRMERVAVNAERAQARGELAHAMAQINALRQQIEALSADADRLSKMLPLLIEGYDQMIPQSFQEIFDPALAQNRSEMIDDSPAGFRLAYKHGKMWTFIRSAEEFIHTLREFFEQCERELSSQHFEVRNWIESFSTDLIQYIQTPEFLQQSMERALMNPALRGGKPKPWEYISGGTMPALLMVYYNRHQPFSSLQKKIQNAQELLAFLVDSAGKTKGRALMHSPTHAFLFRPDWMPQDPYQSIEEARHFWKSVDIPDEERLAEKVALRLPEESQALFLHRWRQLGTRDTGGALPKLRSALLESAPSKKQASVDAALFEALPLVERQKAIELAADMLQVDPTPFFPDAPWIASCDVRQCLKVAFIASRSPFAETDIDEKIASAMRERRMAPPKPILFADTNWSAGLFGLIPFFEEIELWRFNRTGVSGAPMRVWFQLQCDGDWIILHRKEEYTPRI